MFRAVPCLRAVAPAPVGWLHDVDRMTKPCQPSPRSPRVGSHDWRLEAFSAFTPVTAHKLAACLSQALSRQLRRVGCPSRRDDGYRGGSTVPRVGLSPTGIAQHHDARLPSPPLPDPPPPAYPPAKVPYGRLGGGGSKDCFSKVKQFFSKPLSSLYVLCFAESG